LAGAEGFEPPNASTKNWCLTTWRRPIAILQYLFTTELYCSNFETLAQKPVVSYTLSIATMHVIDHRRKPLPEQKQRSHKPVIILLVLAVVGAGLYTLIKAERTGAPTQNNVSNTTVNQNIAALPKKGTLKNFTGQQFRDLYNTFTYPNTAPINEDTPITGNEQADARIRKVAIARGYQSRSAPVTDAFKDIAKGFQLQQPAAQPWLDMVVAAKKDGVAIGLTAAYRSADDQKQLFLNRLTQLGIPAQEIATGSRDAEISQVLRTTAIPGYSRHHTGYTVDIACEDMPASSFINTNCFKWLSANNYEHAKTFGWIPSYPEGTGNQGPDPESWEYVWVGKDAVTE
jgi:LAS superfamily LD-carboxypeptidase LdcB